MLTVIKYSILKFSFLVNDGQLAVYFDCYASREQVDSAELVWCPRRWLLLDDPTKRGEYWFIRDFQEVLWRST